MPNTAPVHVPRLAPGLVSRELGDEIVVVDERTGTAHALTGAAASAYRAVASGEMPAGTSDEVPGVFAELAAKNLLETSMMTRRLMLQRAGTVALAGGIMTIGLPSVAAASSDTPPPQPATQVPTMGFSWTAPGNKNVANATITVTGGYGNATSGTVTVTARSGNVAASNVSKSATVSNGSATISLEGAGGSSGSVTITYSGGNGASGPYSTATQTFTT